MKRNEICAGNRLVLSNGNVEVVYSVKGELYISPEGSNYLSFELKELCDQDLLPMKGYSEIKEIRDYRGNTIWTRPTEMTVAEIEKALSLMPGTLRIKK